MGGGGPIYLESSAESREYMLTCFLGNGNIFLLRGWNNKFIGGMGRNLWGMNPPIPPGFAPLQG